MATSAPTTDIALADPNAPRVYGDSAFQVGVPLPGILYLDDLAAILGVGMVRARHLQAAGELAPFEMKPRIGNRARYSGRKVQRWLDGEAENTPRFFKQAR